ncbi:hypothetical protein [Novosphingobium sp. ES2-1]|uniref:hypothetical protein n=1 Tax=Novosphingobium sp. ES2-1 TaxID=2780074 RepID=UPI00187E82D1|nr:hypothetical protein [Novosphingobium sp. ES2-1]QOV94162.1 hypothetical protein IM701_01305 [Novosphingobium sp. ES2-1]
MILNLVLAAMLFGPLVLLRLFQITHTSLIAGFDPLPNRKAPFCENPKFVVTLFAALTFTGYLYLLYSLAVTFLRYGLPPCESDEAVFWSRMACSVGLFLGGTLLFLPRKSSGFRCAVAVGLPTVLCGVQYLVINHNEQQQAACAARSLPEAMAACRSNTAHYRFSTSSEGFATLTLIAPGTTDRAWNCLTNWTYHAESAPSLKIDESVYAAARRRAKLNSEM